MTAELHVSRTDKGWDVSIPRDNETLFNVMVGITTKFDHVRHAGYNGRTLEDIDLSSPVPPDWENTWLHLPRTTPSMMVGELLTRLMDEDRAMILSALHLIDKQRR